MPCSERPLRCGRVCGQLLPCGRHRCTQTCHQPGECSACPNEGPRTCPCGKVSKQFITTQVMEGRKRGLVGSVCAMWLAFNATLLSCIL